MIAGRGTKSCRHQMIKVPLAVDNFACGDYEYGTEQNE